MRNCYPFLYVVLILAGIFFFWAGAVVAGLRSSRERMLDVLATPSGKVLPADPQYGDTFKLTTDSKFYVCVTAGYWHPAVRTNPRSAEESASWIS